MQRFVIVGTAPSYRQAPFQDPDAYVVSLNDAYLCKGGIPRADAWYDFHPLDKLYHPPAQDGKVSPVFAHDVPFGYYVRPESHRDWLATQPFPVWLHPDHTMQWPQSASWPNAHAFPKAEIEAHFGRYFGSSPSWILAHAILQGYRDIEVYGIHLSTEAEYVDQRPNFEFLCGGLLGAGKRTVTVADGKRIYESADGRLVLPVASPVLDATFQYGFDPSPRRKADPLHWDMHKAQVKRDRRIRALVDRRLALPWVRFEEPNAEGIVVRKRVLASTLQQEIRYYDALLADQKDQLAALGV